MNHQKGDRRAQGRQPRRNAGKDNRGRVRRLVDKTVKPTKRVYRPPPPEACECPPTFSLYPTGSDNDRHRIVVRYKLYRGLIVDFSINQEAFVGRRWETVARIDCCGGTIHRHQYDSDGNDIIGHEVIEESPPDEGGWKVVDKGYLTAYAVMHDEWEDNLRRWRNDAA